MVPVASLNTKTELQHSVPGLEGPNGVTAFKGASSHWRRRSTPCRNGHQGQVGHPDSSRVSSPTGLSSFLPLSSLPSHEATGSNPTLLFLVPQCLHPSNHDGLCAAPPKVVLMDLPAVSSPLCPAQDLRLFYIADCNHHSTGYHCLFLAILKLPLGSTLGIISKIQI